MTCANVDECSESPTPPCDPLTACVDTYGSFNCTACPRGYRGSGTLGCREVTRCDVGNGGCWVDPSGSPRQECADAADGSGSVCGRCPGGYDTTPAGCLPRLGCLVEPKQPGSDTPCAPGVACASLPPGKTVDGLTFTCGACPTGYAGDGAAPSCPPLAPCPAPVTPSSLHFT